MIGTIKSVGSAALVVLGGCAHHALPEGMPIALTPAQVEAVEAGVRRSLKDPNSGRVESVLGSRTAAGHVQACGLVNGRNSYGAFTGARPFVGMMIGGSFEVISIGDGDTGDMAVRVACQRLGLRAG